MENPEQNNAVSKEQAMARLLALATEIMNDSSAAEAEGYDVEGWLNRWIETPQRVFAGKTANEMLDSEGGLEIVLNTLGALRSGAYL